MEDNYYENLMSSIMNDEKKALILKKNINFVGKYLSKIEEHFDNKAEREIAYRELGTIAFSCIEYLLKTVLLNLNKECEHQKCGKKCVFICKIERIEKMHLFEVFDLLYESQVLWLKECEIDEMLWLREQRNGVHLSKDLVIEFKGKKYDKNYVQRMINCFLHLLDSFERNMPYFYGFLYCSEQSDGEEAKKMKIIRQNRQMLLCKSRLLRVLPRVFDGENLTDKERWWIERIEIPNYINFEEINKHINVLADSYVRRCEYENKIVNRTKILKRVTKYLKKEDNKKRIMTYNENKKTEIKQ